MHWDLPGGLVVKTPCFQCRGHEFIPSLAGERRSHTPHGRKREKINKLIKISRKKRVNMHQTLRCVCVCVCVCACACWLLSCVCNPMELACQGPLSMEFSRQEYWIGLPFPSPGYLPNPAIKLKSPVLQADS